MVHGSIAVVFFVVFKHREIDYPQRPPFVGEVAAFCTVLMADFDTQSTNGFVDHFGFIRAKKDDVAVLGTGLLDNGFQGVFRQEFHNRALQAAVFAVGKVGHIVHFDISQAFGAVDADKFGVFVDVFAAQFRTAGHAQGHHATAFHVGCAAEHFEFFRFHQFGKLGEFQVDAQIGFVGAVVKHGFAKRHAREVAQLYIQRVFKYLLGHALGDVHDFVFAEE